MVADARTLIEQWTHATENQLAKGAGYVSIRKDLATQVDAVLRAPVLRAALEFVVDPTRDEGPALSDADRRDAIAIVIGLGGVAPAPSLPVHTARNAWASADDRQAAAIRHWARVTPADGLDEHDAELQRLALGGEVES